MDHQQQQLCAPGDNAAANQPIAIDPQDVYANAFVSADCVDAHSVMEAYLQKPVTHKAVRVPSPVPSLMLVVATQNTDDAPKRRLLMVMKNQTLGEVSILPPVKRKIKRRALMFSGIMPHSLMTSENHGGLCIVNLSDVLVIGRKYKWPSFDALMRHIDGTPMDQATLRKHSVKLKDGKGRRPITILNNVLVVDRCTWFLMSLAGKFYVEREYEGVNESAPTLVEYQMSTLPYARLQTVVGVVRNVPPPPPPSDLAGAPNKVDTSLAIVKQDDGCVSCFVNSMVIDVPYDLAIGAFETGACEEECPEFCRDMLRCLREMDAVGEYKPQPLELWMTNMRQRLDAKRRAEEARVASESDVATASADKPREDDAAAVDVK